MRKLLVYCIPPIDDWTGFLLEADYLKAVRAEEPHIPASWLAKHPEAQEEIEAQLAEDEASYEAFRSKAFELAKSVHWEGDIADGPYISMIPGGGNAWPLLIWKQANNGTCFIACLHPIRFPGLEVLYVAEGSF